jgi:alpha-1,3-mannosyltransferase
VRVHVFDRSTAIAHILEGIQSGAAQLAGFCNAHTVNIAERDEQFATALRSFLMLNDGVGVDLASVMLYGRPFPSNLVGTDFVPALLDAAKSDLRIFLLGSSASVVAKAGSVMQDRYPRHAIVGTHHGFFAANESQAVVAAIRAASPNLVLVGMGQPRQELWSLKYLAREPVATLCVGALLEFTAGSVPRAPDWIRSARLEWLYRLALEPRRLGRRYLIGNIEFIVRLFRDYANQRRSSRRNRRRC